jgi:tRNA U34 5-carboxymethylaminomethyl modifying enzyme MnmG/GidA
MLFAANMTSYAQRGNYQFVLRRRVTEISLPMLIDYRQISTVSIDTYPCRLAIMKPSPIKTYGKARSGSIIEVLIA